MNKTLYFFKWNNIRNRIYKGKPNISDALYIRQNFNFNRKDGVDTDIYIDIDDSVFQYDYILVVDNNGSNAWYITDVVRQSHNQVNLSLHRDLFADYIDELKTQQWMIKRGWCDESNDAIYNTEGLQFNQIKTREELLKDRSNTPWIIGFVPLGLSLTETGVEIFSTPELTNAETIAGINNLPIKNIGDNDLYILNSSKINVNVRMKKNTALYTTPGSLLMFGNGEFWKQQVGIDVVGTFNFNEGTTIRDFSNKLVENTSLNSSYWNNLIYSNLKGNNTHELFTNSIIEQYDGKLYYDTTQSKYYRVNINRIQEQIVLSDNNVKASSGNLASAIRTYMLSRPELIESTPFDTNASIGQCEIIIDKYYIEFVEELPKGTYRFVKSEFTDDSVKVRNQPYKMFAFPLERMYTTRDADVIEEDETQTIVNDPDVIGAFLAHWTKDNGRILDLQIVPYCPCLENIMSTGIEGVKDLYIGNAKNINLYDNTTGYCKARGIWILEDSFSFNIDYDYSIKDYKTELECDMMRLTSPHYEESFEFNPVKMNGFNGFKVECTYKPYSPYIHVCPIYKNGSLYGTEQFNDARGLVTTSAYSLPLASEQWATYQRTNSIYQLAFNRDIEHLEIQNQYSLIKELFGTTGAIGGGAMAGFAKGGIGGAVTGGLTGGAGGLLNMTLNQRLRQENINYKADVFSYNLRNIQAQPQTLTKVSALDINNRLFPVLEYYSCTNGEKLYFMQYLYYNGYTINRIGKIEDFVNPENDYTFIQADFVRSTINCDAHELQTMIDELSIGWYFMPL